MIMLAQALAANNFTHVSKKNADGTPVRARRNGSTKTWKRDLTKFRIPVKYGLKYCFYIDNDNAHEWNAVINGITVDAVSGR